MFPANVSTRLEINDLVCLLKAERHMYTALSSHTPALVSCLGQGPCFSKITYMVTACNYSEGMYSTVVYCAFF